MTKLEKIEKKIKKLSPKHLDEVDKLLDTLTKKQSKNTIKKMKLNQRGALSNIKENYTSVQLQHKATEWIIEDSMKNKF